VGLYFVKKIYYGSSTLVGVSVGVAVGSGLGVMVGVNVGSGVSVGRSVGVAVGVAVGVGVGTCRFKRNGALGMPALSAAHVNTQRYWAIVDVL
jgi:hypothetical protein